MHYVALSRATNTSNVHILNLNGKNCITEDAKQEMSRLRKQPLKPCTPSLYNLTETSTIKVLLQNGTSLHLHIDDIKCEYQAAYVSIFVETR